MKKALLALLLVYSNISAQVVITMEQDGGVYKVPCIVNGAKMKFIFDTGASSVCISESMAEYLLDNDYISKDDFSGSGSSIVADGREVKHQIIILRDIEIAGLHLYNVESNIIEGQRAPLLLGQSAIQKLGKVSIDGNKLIISNATDNYYERLNQLKRDAEYYGDIKYYAKSLQLWEEYFSLKWERHEATSDDYLILGDYSMQTKEYHKAISYYEKVGRDNANPDLLMNMGIAYCDLNNLKTSNVFFERALSLYLDNNDLISAAQCDYFMSYNYLQMKYYNEADLRARLSVVRYLEGKYPNIYQKVNQMSGESSIFSYLESLRFKDECLAGYIWCLAYIHLLMDDQPNCRLLRIASNLGSSEASKDLNAYRRYCY